jgi:hypothetical protein
MLGITLVSVLYQRIDIKTYAGEKAALHFP